MTLARCEIEVKPPRRLLRIELALIQRMNQKHPKVSIEWDAKQLGDILGNPQLLRILRISTITRKNMGLFYVNLAPSL
jgi:hypothetical protein